MQILAKQTRHNWISSSIIRRRERRIYPRSNLFKFFESHLIDYQDDNRYSGQ